MAIKNSYYRDTVFRFALALFGGAFLIGLCGVLTIYSSQSRSTGLHPLLLPGKQLLFLLLGMLIMALAAQVKFDFWVRKAWFFAVIGVALLILVFPFGVSVNGMTGWFAIGALYVQPSELARFAFVLTLAMINARLSSDWQKFFYGALFSSVWIGLILLEPDFGTAVIYFAIFLGGYVLSGGKWRYLALVPLALIPVVIGFFLRYPYAWARIMTYLNPESDPHGAGYHAMQFKLAIARGGWFGEKLGRAVWSNSYLPFSYNDSAFATMAETLGLVGVMVFVVLFSTIISMLFVQGTRLPSGAKIAKMYIGMTAFGIAFQALLHIGVNTAILPTTGLTLPLISYGGSSIFGTLIMLGVAVSAANVHRHDYEKFEN